VNDKNDSITTLSDAWEVQENEFKPTLTTELILLGDFNRHHPTWEGNANSHLTSPDRLLNLLLELIVNMRLEMVLPKGIPTLEARHEGRWTRPDNVWRNANTVSTILACKVQEKKEECIIGYIDNTTLLTSGRTFKEAHNMIK